MDFYCTNFLSPKKWYQCIDRYVCSNTDIDPWTVVVHLRPGLGGKKEGGIRMEAQNDFNNSR